jgi:hypothetical protein
MVKLGWFAVAGVAVLSLAPALVANFWVTYAQAQEPPHAIYCRGPLTTLRRMVARSSRRRSNGASEAAMKENPGRRVCVGDRAPQGNEEAR